MIDSVFWLVKITLGFSGAFLVYSAIVRDKTDRFIPGVALFMLGLFMAGVELVTGSETPWKYLILSGSEHDWLRAFFGGTLLLMLPVILLAVCGKDLDRIIEGAKDEG